MGAITHSPSPWSSQTSPPSPEAANIATVVVADLIGYAKWDVSLTYMNFLTDFFSDEDHSRLS